MTLFGKKSLVLAVLLAAVTFAASAYDGTIDTCLDLGSFSRSEFMNEAGTESFDSDMYSLLAEYLANDGGSIERFFAIDADSLDAEDSDLLDATESYLKRNARVKNGSTFLTIVVRGQTDAGADGWCIVSNFAKDCVHVLYYFNAAF